MYRLLTACTLYLVAVSPQQLGGGADSVGSLPINPPPAPEANADCDGPLPTTPCKFATDPECVAEAVRLYLLARCNCDRTWAPQNRPLGSSVDPEIMERSCHRANLMVFRRAAMHCCLNDDDPQGIPVSRAWLRVLRARALGHVASDMLAAPPPPWERPSWSGLRMRMPVRRDHYDPTPDVTWTVERGLDFDR